MPEPLTVAVGVAVLFTLGGFAITRAGRNAGHVTILLAAAATALGMLAGIVALMGLDARNPATSRAEARPDYGMSWRPATGVPAEH